MENFINLSAVVHELTYHSKTEKAWQRCWKQY